MSFRAGLQVLVGCQFNRASRLLSAAERGAEGEVQEASFFRCQYRLTLHRGSHGALAFSTVSPPPKPAPDEPISQILDRDSLPQVLSAKPQLAAFSGFHGTTSPLHRAVVAGHLSTCRIIVRLIRERLNAAEEAATKAKGKHSVVKRWKALLQTVLDQRTNKGLTPLMLACEKGHADIVAFLLAEGADPLLVDIIHCKTALHYAAMGGHASCVRLLCSDAATVTIHGARRPLRTAVLSDLSVQSATFIDQRSYGGLTALHYAAVSGSLESVMELLRAGASIMVKTDGEAYIGEEHLTPGSTPLHVAVIVRSLPLAHALIQAHAELMTVPGVGRDERRRRPWEGHSRTDVRSMRNAQRRLPYHLARERGLTALMHLVDPRVSADHALDAARDAEHGLGPRRLATICSMALQQSLLSWLDRCQTDMLAEERAVATTAAKATTSPPAVPGAMEVTLVRPGGSTGAHGGGVTAGGRGKTAVRRSWSFASLTAAAAGTVSGVVSPEPSHRVENGGDDEGPSGLSVATQNEERGVRNTEPLARESSHVVAAVQSAGTATGEGGIEMERRSMELVSPFAGLEVDHPSSCEHADRSQDTRSAVPREDEDEAPEQGGTCCHHQQEQQRQRQEIVRLTVAASAPVTPRDRVRASTTETSTGASTAPPVPSLNIQPMGSLHAYVGMLSVRRPALPHHERRGSAAQEALTAAAARDTNAASGTKVAASPLRLPRARSAINLPSTAAHAAGVASAAGGVEGEGGASATATPGGAGAMIRAFSTLRDRLRSMDFAVQPEADRTSPRSVKTDAKCTLDSDDTSVCGSLCDEDAEESVLEQECGVCLDRAVEVAFAGCDHALCIECARHLTQQEKKPPSCPFCRRMVVGFRRVC